MLTKAIRTEFAKRLHEKKERDNLLFEKGDEKAYGCGEQADHGCRP
jgi:hypothetical protein